MGENTAIGPVPGGPPPAYYPYEPKKIEKLSELPEAVREKLAAHLRGRLGETFYERLQFAGGEAVDARTLHRTVPAFGDWRNAPAWTLWFEWTDPAAGVRMYTATVTLRKDGTVAREIDLPPFATEPEKARFVPLAEVTAGLLGKGEINEASTVSIGYDAKEAQLLWHYETVLPGAGPEVRVKTLDVNANTGTVVPPKSDVRGP